MPRLVLILCLAFFFASDADAAITFKSKSAMLTREQVSEPKPAPGDVLLPMPGGLSLTLRAVCIPASGYLDATEVQQGVQSTFPSETSDETSGDRGQYAEQRHILSLSAPFELEDIPSAWGNDILEFLQKDLAVAISGDSGIKPYIYFIGKYEITRAQWRAVMEPPVEGTPFSIEEDDYLPITGISWFDVQDFTRRYSEWLMQHKPEYLPYFSQENVLPLSVSRRKRNGNLRLAAAIGSALRNAAVQHCIPFPKGRIIVNTLQLSCTTHHFAALHLLVPENQILWACTTCSATVPK